MYSMGQGVTQSYEETARWWGLSAAQGFMNAQHNFALLLETGRGVPLDLDEALRFYKLAAAQGNPNAKAEVERLSKRS
jgi:TPR repeat protein